LITKKILEKFYFNFLGHFPVYSVAEHGSTECLIQKVKPLLHKYKVSAYLSGHDHDLQHISHTDMGSTVEYIGILK
jgi:tartrate-resistant acid phosphatase type 5